VVKSDIVHYTHLYIYDNKDHNKSLQVSVQTLPISECDFPLVFFPPKKEEKLDIDIYLFFYKFCTKQPLKSMIFFYLYLLSLLSFKYFKQWVLFVPRVKLKGC